MADEQVKLSDIIDPEVVGELVATQFPNELVLAQTGAMIVDENPNIKSEGGQRLLIPKWKLGNRTWQRLTDSTSLESRKIQAASGYGVVVRRGNAYAVRDLATIVSAQDPNLEISGSLSAEVAVNMQSTFFTVLEGAATALGTSNIFDATAETTKTMTVENIVKAKAKLGDKQNTLSVLVCHSKQFSDLFLQGVVEYKNAQNQLGLASITGDLPTVAGLIIAVTDDVPVTAGSPNTYDAFLLGKGALYLGYQRDFNFETDRDITAKLNIMSYDLHFLPMLNGTSYKDGSPLNPADADLISSANWELFYDNAKSVKAVKLITQ